MILEVKNLGVHFPGHVDPTFSGISFAVPRGCMFGIFGETGCGKSTLAQCLIGFVAPPVMKGEIFFYFSSSYTVAAHTVDENFWRKEMRGKKVVYIPQDPYKSLNPHEKVGMFLSRVLHAHGNRFTVVEILQKVGLVPDIEYAFASMMSAGQRQRVMIASALAVQAELIVLDEPTASTDAQGRRIMRDCFQHLTELGVTVVIISHEIDEYLPIIADENRLYFSKITSTMTMPKASPGMSNVSLDMPVLLKLSSITKNFNGLPVLANLDMSIHINQWVYIEGSNGTGKTTLLRIIAGLQVPDTGKYEWMGKQLALSRILSCTQSVIHPVFQDAFNSLDPKLTIAKSIDEVVTCAKKQHRPATIQRANDLWHILELPDFLYKLLPHQLSYGQQKRVVFMRTLLKYEVERHRQGPMHHLFLFDEAFAGIHWTLRDKMISILQKMSEEKKISIIWVAHGHEVLKDMCDQIYSLKSGKLERINR